MAISSETVDLPSSRFRDGVEFEETFPEPQAETPPAPAPAPVNATPAAPAADRFPPAPPREGAHSAPRLTVVRGEPASQPPESVLQERLDRRLQEAELLVKQTIESVRLEEEKRLAEWVKSRREEEERRLAKWTEERRSAVERSMPQRSSADDVVQRVEEMLSDHAERQRISDEERLQAWRSELERALNARDQRASLRTSIAAADNARDVGRILRDVAAELAHMSAFALALHQDGRDEVAYRYRVANDDEVGNLLRRETLDDGPESAAAHADGWLRAQRTVRAGSRNVTFQTAQLAVRAGGKTLGVLTLQGEGGPITDSVLAQVADLAALAAPCLAALRDAGSFRGA